MKRADAIWNKGPELIDQAGEVRELTVENFRRSTPFSKLPDEEQRFLLSVKDATIRPDPVKKTVSIELSSDVLEKFEAKGKGWESKVDEALREWLEEHKAS